MNTKVKKVVIPVMTMVIMASQLMGCASTSQSEMLKMINKGEQIEIVVEVSDFVEQGEESAITWETLDKLSTYDGFRLIMDSELGITCTTTKHGTIYINLDGQQEGNNTLYNALSNKAFAVTQFEDETIHENLRAAILDAYTDLEEADIDAAIFNAYFNLLPDSTPSYFNGGASLTRAEAMALLMRATTPVGELEDKWTDISALGEATNDYVGYASYSDQFAFISTVDKSLNEKTLNGTMTRGEFIYMVMDAIYGDVKADTTVTVNDCKDAGDIAKAQEFNGKDFCNSYTLQYALKNADAGAPTVIYNALTKAVSDNIISADTAWDESITKADAILILVDTIKAFNNTNGYKVDAGIGETSAEVIETAKGYYNEHKADLNCTEQEFIDEYVARVESGLSEEEALNSVVLQFTPWDEDPGNNSDTDTDTDTTEPSTEDETTKPEDSETPETQAPTETPNNNNNNSSGNNNNNNNSSGGNTQEQQTPVTTQPAQTEPPKPAETTPVQTEPAKPAETTPPAVDNGNSNQTWYDPADTNKDGTVTIEEAAASFGMTVEEYKEFLAEIQDDEWN